MARPVAALIAPHLEALAQRVQQVSGLSASEKRVVAEAGDTALRINAHLKLGRLLLLELHAAGLAGQLTASDEHARWEQFLALSSQPSFAAHLDQRYPALRERLDAVCRFQTEAILALASRFAADRVALRALPGSPQGELVALHLGAGDTHRGGQSVARLELAHGAVMYKPRSLGVDIALQALLDRILEGNSPEGQIRLPQVLDRGDYGWTEFVIHRYCEGDAELTTFYRNLGHWLAVMRLVGGTDLHSENVIAQGPVPVVIDVESLFTPEVTAAPSGSGEAVDIAAATIRGTVLRTGLLPLRTPGLALAGVDISAAGAVPGQQPRIRVPTIDGEGTSKARLGMTTMELPATLNHPSPRPVLDRYWDQIVVGFRDLTGRILELNTRVGVRRLLSGFLGREVRMIRRPTQAYVEILRMLWHPASLHDEPKAIARARDILRRNAEALPIAPKELEVIDREIAEMRQGDIPVFTEKVGEALIERVAQAWQSADWPLEELTIQGTLVSAYLNEGIFPPRNQVSPEKLRLDQLDARRRALAGKLVRELRDAAIRGSDGTATWISPVLSKVGWAIRPLLPDLYTGQGGVALVLAEYLHEVRHGRADAVDGLPELLDGTLAVLRGQEDHGETPPHGALLGLPAQVWTWTALHELSGNTEFLARAAARAAELEKHGFDDDRQLEILGGAAGAIVPLLNLAELRRDARWHDLAAAAARHVARHAVTEETGVRWSTAMFPGSVGGFAHGALGIGWALTRAALAEAGTQSERQQWLELAEGAFRYQDSLFRPEAANWLDRRPGNPYKFTTSWCHGSAGIGLAAADLYVRTRAPRYLDVLRRATVAGVRDGFGWSHTLCHGDLGLWELFETSRHIDPGYAGPERAAMDGELLSGLEERGPVGGLAREAFTPGLMPGMGGVIHVLLHMHPEANVTTPLVLGQRPGASTQGR